MNLKIKVECSQCGEDLFFGACEVEGNDVIVVTPCDCQTIQLSKLMALDKKIDVLESITQELKAKVKER